MDILQSFLQILPIAPATAGVLNFAYSNFAIPRKDAKIVRVWFRECRLRGPSPAWPELEVRYGGRACPALTAYHFEARCLGGEPLEEGDLVLGLIPCGGTDIVDLRHAGDGACEPRIGDGEASLDFKKFGRGDFLEFDLFLTGGNFRWAPKKSGVDLKLVSAERQELALLACGAASLLPLLVSFWSPGPPSVIYLGVATLLDVAILCACLRLHRVCSSTNRGPLKSAL